MHLRNQTDQEFDDFRRERKRVQAKLGPQASVLGYENQALRELEQVEAREVRDQQLTREVHDFFAAATRQAAAIVEKVAQDAEQEIGERVDEEVEGFLMDALSRMNNFIVSVMQQRRNVNIAETQVEPHVGHIVGPDLDEFRYAGTTDTREDHIGQDPFATTVEDVQREFRAVVSEMEGMDAPASSIEDHLVAETMQADEYDEDAEDRGMLTVDADDDEQGAGEVQVEAPRPEPRAQAPRQAAEVDSLDQEMDEEQTTPQQELETFKGALKTLVRQGVMKREEARAAWLARLASMGRASR